MRYPIVGIRYLTFSLILIIVWQICWVKPTSAESTTLAIVNGKSLSSMELYWEIKQLIAEMHLRNRPISDPQIRELRGQLVENIIEREILYQEAQSKNIQIRPQWVEASLSELKEQLGGTSGLKAYLADTDMTQVQLKEHLTKGLTVRQLLRKEPIRSIKVSDAEMNAFYRQHPELFQRNEQVRIRHILVAVNDLNDEAQRTRAGEKIQNLKRQLEGGASFAVLALEYSDCPSRARAGDLGYLTRDQMIPSFSEAAFELQPGQISDVVETRFGYHLIKVIDRRPSSLLSYNDVREKIERTLRRNKENSAIKSFVAQLKRQSQIKRFQ